MGDGAGAAIRRFAVAAADWKSVGGVWTPESEENRWSRPREHHGGLQIRNGIADG